MKTVKLALLLIFFVSVDAGAQLDYSATKYSGFEEICSIRNGKKICFTDPENPKYKWYHKSVYTVIHQSDSVFLEQSPVFIDKGDTVHSASDGGYYYYRGIYTLKGDTYTFYLQPSFCEYCDKKDFLPRKVLAVKKNGGLMIKGRFFRKGE